MTTSGAHDRQPPITERLTPPGDDTDTVYYAPREGDLAMLALLLTVVLGTGGYTWHQLGGENPTGRAIFFGLFLFCMLWVAIVYTFKLSFGVVVGPHGLSLTRGPWRTELSWAETARLVERTESNGSRNYRWVVAMAYDTRRLQVREDMVSDYDRFRQDVYLRHRNWQDHGGTWGTAASGPFTASDDIRSRITWQLIAFALFLLPGLYFTLLLPETGLVGPVILLGAATFAVLVVRTWLGRQTYAVDNHSVSARRLFRPETVLRWRAMTKVERVRHPFGWVFRLGILLGNGLLELAARGDSRVRSFPWAPRVPEYLILRGAGHQVRIRLHQLARPDELLAWVEFYERIGRHATTRPASKSRPVPATLSFASPDQAMATPAGGVVAMDGLDGLDALDTAQTPIGVPRDPWAAAGTPASAGATTQPTASRPTHPGVFPPPAYTPAPRNTYETEYRYAASAPGSTPTSDDDAWLRETEAHLRAARPGSIPGVASHPGTPTPPAGHITRPAHLSQPAEHAARPSVPSRPAHQTHPARPTQPPQPPQPPRPIQQPPYYQPGPTQPRPLQPNPPTHPPTHPPMPTASTPDTSQHDDGFDAPTMDFQHAPPPPLPRFGPTKPEE